MSHSYLPGTASLLEELDKRLLVLLRDGRTLIGYLRSVDQFGSLVLHRCIERIHVGKDYGDIPRGIFLVRGESVVLLGEVDESKDELKDLRKVSLEEILEAQSKKQAELEEEEKLRAKAFKDRGLNYTAEVTYDDN